MNPYLFIVGCPRSGTTLLKRLLDVHPQIAITPESHWIPRWFHKKAGKGLTPDGLVKPKLLRKLFQFPRFLELGITRDDVEKIAAGPEPVSYARFVTALFDLYGEQRSKPIVGDKTPGYARDLPTLHTLWPEARFVHLIRDGRDVCLSILNWERAKNWKAGEGVARFPSWNSDVVGTIALWWEWHVRLAREAGGELGDEWYHEVRYEAFVAQPEDECRALCRFLRVPWDGDMVRSYEHVARSNLQLNAQHPWLPITPGRRDWQTQMCPADVERFETLAESLLAELGYRSSGFRLSARKADVTHARRMFAREVLSQRYLVPAAW
jgi:hypothetical protein